MDRVRAYSKDVTGKLRVWGLGDIDVADVPYTASYFNSGQDRRELYNSLEGEKKHPLKGPVLICISN